MLAAMRSLAAEVVALAEVGAQAALAVVLCPGHVEVRPRYPAQLATELAWAPLRERGTETAYLHRQRHHRQRRPIQFPPQPRLQERLRVYHQGLRPGIACLPAQIKAVSQQLGFRQFVSVLQMRTDTMTLSCLVAFSRRRSLTLCIESSAPRTLKR